jgi:hypothetical protein
MSSSIRMVPPLASSGCAGADQADVVASVSVGYDEKLSGLRFARDSESLFTNGVLRIRLVEGMLIIKHRRRFVECDEVLPLVDRRLRGIPIVRQSSLRLTGLSTLQVDRSYGRSERSGRGGEKLVPRVSESDFAGVFSPWPD